MADAAQHFFDPTMDMPINKHTNMTMTKEDDDAKTLASLKYDDQVLVT